MDRRPLTQAEKDAAMRLSAIWQAKKKKLGITQETAAAQFGCNQSTISHYLTGRIPLNVAAILKFAQILRINPSEIDPNLLGVDNMVSASNVRLLSHRDVPLLTQSQIMQFAADPDAFDASKATAWLPCPVAVGGNAFLMQWNGDSMSAPSGKSFPDGSLLIVDPDAVAGDGSFILAQIGNDIAFKQLVSDAGSYILRPLNPQYPARPMPDNATIIGVVKGMILEI